MKRPPPSAALAVMAAREARPRLRPHRTVATAAVPHLRPRRTVATAAVPRLRPRRTVARAAMLPSARLLRPRPTAAAVAACSADSVAAGNPPELSSPILTAKRGPGHHRHGPRFWRMTSYSFESIVR